MLAKRIIPCLDVKDGRVVKGVNFVGLKDAGDPVGLALEYSRQGADEIVFLDIAASNEGRKARLEWVGNVAKALDIPFTVGGGIGSVDDIRELLLAGADKVALNTSAVLNQQLISAGAAACGSQCIVVAIDSKFNGKFNEVYIYGGKKATGIDAIEWAKKCARLGAGEILLTSIDRDGTVAGFNVGLVREVCSKIGIPVIASGGAGRMQDFYEVFADAGADAALAASVFHYGKIKIPELKRYLKGKSIEVRG
ncbi:imidazole glycerol phosphate synthase subunit HisF [Candidatus Parvarchaeota archaeon]|nr:imidazole glycerol phosphate synthase subunit HisF [Candidatus Parvarchaeota archaeon]